MIIVVLLLVFAILSGIAGSIILILGIINKHTVSIIIGGIMLLFTLLFCAGSVSFAVHHHMCVRDCEMMMHRDFHHNQDGCCNMEEMKASCCKQHPDSAKMCEKKMECTKK